jgi:hypothetical protein
MPGRPAYGGPMSPTFASADGFDTSTIAIPGCSWTFDEAWHG